MLASRSVLLAALASAVVGAPTVSAAPRTFVASNGQDINPCSLAFPCRSFAAALALTDVGGELIVLDSAGYGPVTITKSVSIAAPDGVYAGVTAPSGNGITVTAGAGDVVSLRGLRLNGTGATHGIQVTAVGQLHVARTEIAGFTGRGIDFAAPGSLYVSDSAARDNGETGVHVQTVSGVAIASIDRSRFSANGFNGVVIATNAQGAITNSVAENNGSVGFLVDAGGWASISDCKISRVGNDGYAILARGAGSVATVSRCDVSGTFYGVAAEGVGARLTATDTTVHHSSFGFLAHCGGRVIVERGAVTASGQTSYLSWDYFCASPPPQGAESRMYVSNSVAAFSNSCDFRAEGPPGAPPLIYSRGNSTAAENYSPCVVTAFNPR